MELDENKMKDCDSEEEVITIFKCDELPPLFKLIPMGEIITLTPEDLRGFVNVEETDNSITNMNDEVFGSNWRYGFCYSWWSLS